MPASLTSLGTVHLDSRDRHPLHRQLYEQLREAILSGRLRPGTRLPATRLFAADLRVSRNTVIAAFDQLAAEGYVTSRVGSGTTVAQALPDELLRPVPAPRGRDRTRRADRSATEPLSAAPRVGLGQRGAALASIERPVGPAHSAFPPGIPDHREFPHEQFARLLGRRLRQARTDLSGYAHPAGFPALREAIARHLGEFRAMRCSAEQVIVVTGSQAALDLACRLLIDVGELAWLEEPGYLGARAALVGAGAVPVPIPVDRDGLDPARGHRLAPRARLIYLTPAHQYPTGAQLSLERRLALLDWARQHRGWILEDDYDSEYRYEGRPLAAMHGLDRDGTVLHVGTFAKVLLPALRLAWLVVPSELSDVFARAIRNTGQSPPLALQAALADFICDGHLAAHVRRTRAIYAERREVLVHELRRRLAGSLEVDPPPAGMQLFATLRAGLDDLAVAAAAQVEGVAVAPVSRYFLGPAKFSGLLLGFAAVRPPAIRDGVARLGRAIDTLVARDPRARMA